MAWPYLAGLTLLVAVPAAMTLALAFTEYSALEAPRFVGLDNLTRLLGDDLFWTSLGNSLIYALIAVPLRLSVAVGIALLLNRRTRGVPAARAAAYLPTVVPDAAFALLFLWFFNPLYGPLTAAFEAVGLTSPGWLTDPWTARFSIAIMGAFQIGEAFVVALAARRTIAPSLYEAASVEGASPWYRMTRITLPVMAPIIALLALRDVIFAFQANFVPALLLTGGGPRYATTYLPLYIYRQGFSYFRFGYAAALSLVLFAITVAVVYVQYRLAKRWRLL